MFVTLAATVVLKCVLRSLLPLAAGASMLLVGALLGYKRSAGTFVAESVDRRVPLNCSPRAVESFENGVRICEDACAVG